MAKKFNFIGPLTPVVPDQFLDILDRCLIDLRHVRGDILWQQNLLHHLKLLNTKDAGILDELELTVLEKGSTTSRNLLLTYFVSCRGIPLFHADVEGCRVSTESMSQVLYRWTLTDMGLIMPSCEQFLCDRLCGDQDRLRDT